MFNGGQAQPAKEKNKDGALANIYRILGKIPLCMAKEIQNVEFVEQYNASRLGMWWERYRVGILSKQTFSQDKKVASQPNKDSGKRDGKGLLYRVLAISSRS